MSVFRGEMVLFLASRLGSDLIRIMRREVKVRLPANVSSVIASITFTLTNEVTSVDYSLQSYVQKFASVK